MSQIASLSIIRLLQRGPLSHESLLDVAVACADASASVPEFRGRLTLIRTASLILAGELDQAVTADHLEPLEDEFIESAIALVKTPTVETYERFGSAAWTILRALRD